MQLWSWQDDSVTSLGNAQVFGLRKTLNGKWRDKQDCRLQFLQCIPQTTQRRERRSLALLR